MAGNNEHLNYESILGVSQLVDLRKYSMERELTTKW
jgi:hypothetical protein